MMRSTAGAVVGLQVGPASSEAPVLGLCQVCHVPISMVNLIVVVCGDNVVLSRLAFLL